MLVILVVRTQVWFSGRYRCRYIAVVTAAGIAVITATGIAVVTAASTAVVTASDAGYSGYDCLDAA